VTPPSDLIFVGERSAEQRHDAVARGLVDGTFVVMDGLHHEFEDRIEKFSGLLGVMVGQQLHRALEIGE